MFFETIQLYGGPGDGEDFRPVEGVPLRIFWPTHSGREHLYVMTVQEGRPRYVHVLGDTRGQRETDDDRLRQAG